VKKQVRLLLTVFPYLLLVLGVIFFYFRTIEQTKENEKCKAKIAGIDSLRLANQISSTEINQLHFILSDLANPSTIKIRLNGMPIGPQTFAYVYWDSLSGHVYFNPTGLPQIKEGENYQLWAFGNNQWESLGFVDIKSKPLIQRMQDMGNPRYFGVSGESDKDKSLPALENMWVMGDIKNGY
jgi:hypothetical protein